MGGLRRGGLSNWVGRGGGLGVLWEGGVCDL